MALTLDYAGMAASDLLAWVLLATLAGAAARQIVQGKPILGLWGDMALALIGVFAVGWGLRQAGVDLSQSILAAREGIPSRVAIYVDVFVVAFVGALLLRVLLKVIKQ